MSPRHHRNSINHRSRRFFANSAKSPNSRNSPKIQKTADVIEKSRNKHRDHTIHRSLKKHRSHIIQPNSKINKKKTAKQKDIMQVTKNIKSQDTGNYKHRRNVKSHAK